LTPLILCIYFLFLIGCFLSFRHHIARNTQEDGEEDNCSDETSDGVNEIMRLDINCGTAKQKIERCKNS